jgi:hydrogenase-4 component B
VYKMIALTGILAPIIGSIIIYLCNRKSAIIRSLLAIITSFITFITLVLLLPTALNGNFPHFDVTHLLGMGLTFKYEPLSYMLALLTSLIWLISTVYAFTYLSKSHEKTRFYSFWSITLGSTIGVFASRDLITLFLFFEIMTFSSYVLVIHDEEPHSFKAGRLYLYMGIAGGLSILMGIFLAFHNLGSVSFDALPNLLNNTSLKYIIATLLIAGFGVKAGMVPLHIWLPEAHPAAPSPASAILSGILIKTGVFGIIRVVNGIFVDDHILGSAIVGIGLVTMLLGACFALFQDNVKRVLAYSSISQVGFIITGLGTAVYLGHEGALAFAGAIFHMFNHALFKVLLFLAIGTIYFSTHELSMNRLGGFGRIYPFVFGSFIIGFAGISGLPFFNGYLSKTLIHEALVEAYSFTGDELFNVGERIFMITSSLTVCYILKIATKVFLGKPAGDLHVSEETKTMPLMYAGLGTLAIMVIIIGTLPDLVWKNFIIPSVTSYYPVNHHVLSIDLISISPMMTAIGIIAAGIVIFMLGRHTKLSENTAVPITKTFEFVLRQPSFKKAGVFYSRAIGLVNTGFDDIINKGIDIIINTCYRYGFFESKYSAASSEQELSNKELVYIDITGTGKRYILGSGQTSMSAIPLKIATKHMQTADESNGRYIQPKPVTLNTSVFIFILLITTFIILFYFNAAQIFG